MPEDPKDASIDMDLLAALRQDAAVAEVTPVVQVQIKQFINPNAGLSMEGGPDGPKKKGPVRPKGEGTERGDSSPGSDRSPAALFRGMQGPPTLVGTDAEQPPHTMVEGTWLDSQHPERRGVVIGKPTAEQMKLGVGDEALIILGTKEYRVNVVGLIEAGPSQMGMSRKMRSPGSTMPRTGVEAGPLVATLLGLEPRLLRSQLGSNLWRTLSTTAALTVGLGLFVAMQIWGYSMLEPFKPGDWNPDMLVVFQRGGLPDSEIVAVRAIEGVRADQCIPLAVEQPKLASDITGSEEHNSVISQNNVIMIGLDPQVAFGSADPLVKACFVEGTAADAIEVACVTIFV